jgi:uncharacterized membrane protein YcaP (DUF421 family)
MQKQQFNPNKNNCKMNINWIAAPWPTLLTIIFSAIVMYFVIFILARLVGLRSFSSMSGADYVVTIAIGAMIAKTILSPTVSILMGTVAIASLLILQVISNWLRQKFPSLHGLTDNRPQLLMENGRILEDNLRKTRVNHRELHYELRQASVRQYSQVKYVVLESTGNVSVIKNETEDIPLDEEIISDIAGTKE